MQAEGGGQENEAAEETEFFERIFREAALKKGRGPGRQQKKGDSGGTSGEGGSALWVDSRGSGNRRKYRLKSENGAKAQKWGENSGKTSARHKAGRDRTLGMYRDSRERTIGWGDTLFAYDGSISVRGSVPANGGSGTK